MKIDSKILLPLFSLTILLASCGKGKNESKAKSRPVVIWQSQTEAALKSGPDDPMALFACAQMDNLKRAKELIEAGADPNKPTFFGQCPLHEAAHSNSIEIVKLLLESGANVDVRVSPSDPTSNLWTPLMFAVYRGYPDIVSLLIAHGADVNVVDNYGKPPIYYARDRESYYSRFQKDDAVRDFQNIETILLKNGAKE